MKKILPFFYIAIALFLLLLASCGNAGDSSEKRNGDLMNYVTFLELVSDSGFIYEEGGEIGFPDSHLSVSCKTIMMGNNEIISVYEYPTEEEMENDSKYIDISGSSFHFPNKDTKVSWPSYPHFFKKELLIVNYVGESAEILSFLKKTLGGPFAGYEFWEENMEEDPKHASAAWVIAPTLEYESIGYCPEHEVYYSEEGERIDVKTGEGTGKYCAHGGGWINFYYDKSIGLYGVISMDETEFYYDIFTEKELADNYPFIMDKLNLFGLFDSSKVVTTTQYDENNTPFIEYDTSKAILGKFAVADGIEFITEFIYSDDETKGWRNYNNIIAARLDDKWGIIDKKGNIATPFIYEHAITIDDKTAFAKYEGKYGILKVND